ncbi:hypothetical protein EGI22_10980 [Lacihabitans sp. LS3-19]|uniref:hypothetical protein n=1 Tax=Lacihabitans sp. LS3-19 TaxID=2487335 RepID=UPI0020CE9D03|nr:hypothetical protein [Lacihabitans sp. LS3-19]MCP9768438.1 hypothetical protein [Lacihabitans sp. LS3-19]
MDLEEVLLLSLLIDRYLVFTTGIQKYGTQKYWDEEKKKLFWSPIIEKTTDEERRRNKTKPLAELLKEIKIAKGQN